MSEVLMVEKPEDLFDENGKLRQMLDLGKMDTSDGQMHFLLPPGIGDVAWVMSKFLLLKDRCTFWLNNDDVKRAAPYLDLLGCRYGFCDVDIARLYEAPGEFPEHTQGDVGGIAEGGFIGYIHANHHIESGKRIEDWHPFLPIVNPFPFGRWGWQGGPPLGAAFSGVGDPLPIMVHMGSANYQGQNYHPRVWAKALRRIEANYGPVLCVGAFWDTSFAYNVFEHYRPSLEPMLDKPIGDVFKTMLRCRAMIGVDSGMAIAAKYMGVPTAQYYPRWLRTDTPSKRHPNGTHMPGSWEFDHHPKSIWGFVDEMLDPDEPTNAFAWLENL